MEPLIFSQEIGIVSGILLVAAYGLMNFGVLTPKSPLYQALNVLGALGFTYTALTPLNPGLLITEIVWIIVAAGFLWRIFTRRNKGPVAFPANLAIPTASTPAAETTLENIPMR